MSTSEEAGMILIVKGKDNILKYLIPLDWEGTISNFQRKHSGKDMERLSGDFLRRFRNKILRSLSKGEGL